MNPDQLLHVLKGIGKNIVELKQQEAHFTMTADWDKYMAARRTRQAHEKEFRKLSAQLRSARRRNAR